MKRLYLARPEIQKLSISKKKDAEIERAVKTAEALVRKNPQWGVEIEVAPGKRSNQYPVYDLIFRAHAYIFKGSVNSLVDLNYEGQDGRESAIEEISDYRNLSEVWFHRNFIDKALEPRNNGTRRVKVRSEDKKIMLDQFIAQRDKEIEVEELNLSKWRDEKSLKRLARDVAFDKGILSLADDVKDGKLPFKILQEVWPKKYEIYDPSSEGTRSLGSKER